MVVIRYEGPKGGPLAIVQEGDSITIDIPNKNLTLHVSDEEIAQRLQSWQRPKPKFTTGYLGLYSQLAQSADKGAVFKMP